MSTSISFMVVENIRHGLAIIFNKDEKFNISHEDDFDVISDSDGLHLQIGGCVIKELPVNVIENIKDKNKILNIFEVDGPNISKSWIV